MSINRLRYVYSTLLPSQKILRSKGCQNSNGPSNTQICAAKQLHRSCALSFSQTGDPPPKPDGAKTAASATTAAAAKKDINGPDSHTQVSNSTDQTKAADPTVKVKPKKAKKEHHKSMERNFITAVRAMNEYLLKPGDLDDLRKTYRRSPYEGDPPIAVYLRKDVEARATVVYGSYDAWQKEMKKKIQQIQKYKDDIFQVKKVIREYKVAARNEVESKRRETILHSTKRVVITAVAINAANFVVKTGAWLFTGSHSLFSEAIHSFADTCNQLILYYGISKSIQQADPDHPYGYNNMIYVASLVSGVGIFCCGTGISIYHGIEGLLHPHAFDSLYWACAALGGSLISETGTLIVAINAIKRGAKKENTTVLEYVLRGEDPTVNVVLLEDMAAVSGILIAGSCMGLSTYFQTHIPDAIGSILIGGLLGVVSYVIITTNTTALVGRSVQPEKMQQINQQLENDLMIRAIFDAKCIDMGNNLIRYKAEIDFDGRELTRTYLDNQDLELLLEEMRNMKSIEMVEQFMLKHGENVIDLVGAEIDRIESQLKKVHPELRHCDLEIL